jgi:hypothetical protein
MGSENAKNEINIMEESSEKLSTSTTTPVIDPQTEDDGLALKPTRSRRPTMAEVMEISPSLMGVNRRESGIEPAVKEKWTAKRVLKVTWAYVTTVKVHPPAHVERDATKEGCRGF